MSRRAAVWRALRMTGLPTDNSFEADPEGALREWALELGVTTEVMARMVEQRRALVQDVAADPRAWGLDLLPARIARRDIAAEYRARTRLTGTIAESFLADHSSLLALVPDPPTLPDGTPLDAHLVAGARLEPEVAREIAGHVRSTIQARLGRPLDDAAVGHAVREASWDHDLDVAFVLPRVRAAMKAVL